MLIESSHFQCHLFPLDLCISQCYKIINISNILYNHIGYFVLHYYFKKSTSVKVTCCNMESSNFIGKSVNN